MTTVNNKPELFNTIRNKLPSPPRVISFALKPFLLLSDDKKEKLFKASLNHVFKHHLAEEELDFLQQHWLKVSVTDIQLHFYLSVSELGEFDISFSNKTEDVCFSADLSSLLSLVSREVDPDTLFFQRKLLTTGNMELGLAIKNFLDDVDLEQLPVGISKLLQLAVKLKICTEA